MMKALYLIGFFAVTTLAVPAAQQADTAGSPVLATVNIPTAVLAGGKPLAAGTYQIRFATDLPPAASDAQRRIEFVSKGTVVANEIAEVLRDSDLPTTGDSARPAAQGVRVETLKGGEFVRISVKRNDTRYLIHLAVPGAAGS
jgi:hypothetical protein